MKPVRHDRANTSSSSNSGWSTLVPNVVNCFSRDYYAAAADTPREGRHRRSVGRLPSAGIEIVKTTVGAAEQQREDRKRAEDFLLFMDEKEAPQLAPSPLLSQSALSTVACTEENAYSEDKKPALGKERKPPLPLPPPDLPPSQRTVLRTPSTQKVPRVASLDVGERQPVVVGPLTTLCPDKNADDDVIGQTLCVIPPFLKGHSVAIRITLNDSPTTCRGSESPSSICVGLTTGPQLFRERGMVVSFCSSQSEIKHTRPREIPSNAGNPQPLGLETAVISESRVRFPRERNFWILWGEGLLFAGLGDKVGARLLMAADTASAEYTFGYGAGATSIKERYSTDEVERIYVASRGPSGCTVEWERVEVSSSWLNDPDRYSRALGKTCGWRTAAPTPSPYEKPQWDRRLHRAHEVKLLACIVDSRECALSSCNENPGASLAELAWWLRFVYRPESVVGPEASSNGGLGHAIEVEGIRWSGPMQKGFLRSFNCIGRCRWATVRLGITEKMILTLLERARHEFKEKGIFVEFQPCL